MIQYSLVQSVKVVQGQGTVKLLGEILSESNYCKAFLVFDKGLSSSGIIDLVIKSLKDSNVDYLAFDEVIPDPPANIIDRGAQICEENGCDCVVGIGGGSSIDTAKGINILRFNEGNILDYVGKDYNTCSGLITIPTTSGTGSELSNGAIISDTEHQIKIPFMCEKCMSEYTILDPALTLKLPRQLTLLTGLDVLSHATEAYTSVLSNPMTDLICEKIITTVIHYLPVVLLNGEDLEAREKMQNAAALGGWMLYNACAHVGHSIAHVIGAKYHIIHGAACAYAYPAMIKLLSSQVPQKVEMIGRALSVEFTGSETTEEIGSKTALAYQNFIENIGLNSITTYEINKDDIENLAKEVACEAFAPLSPITITEEVAKDLLTEIIK